jgi:hypothetical protein
MSEGQGVLWNFKVKLKPTVPLGHRATGTLGLILGKRNQTGSILITLLSHNIKDKRYWRGLFELEAL